MPPTRPVLPRHWPKSSAGLRPGCSTLSETCKTRTGVRRARHAFVKIAQGRVRTAIRQDQQSSTPAQTTSEKSGSRRYRKHVYTLMLAFLDVALPIARAVAPVERPQRRAGRIQNPSGTSNHPSFLCWLQTVTECYMHYSRVQSPFVGM